MIGSERGEKGRIVEKVIITGASGRDFHNFNVYFRDNPRYRVVAFTAAQIPLAATRLYPAELAGHAYPEAAVQFLKHGGTRAVITSVEAIEDALEGRAGTELVP